MDVSAEARTEKLNGLSRGRLDLVERDVELRDLRARIEVGLSGFGSLVVVEGPPGIGKSALLDAAAARAHELGIEVLRSGGTRLERDFAFGVAIQLLERRWARADPGERLQLCEGPAQMAGQLLDGMLSGAEDLAGAQSFGIIRALFWLVRNLMSAAADSFLPLAILVDDAQWSDEPSLRLLAYASERLSELPITLVVALRPGGEIAGSGALTALRSSAHAKVIRPHRLSRSGLERLIRQRVPDAEPALASACFKLTRGNPFLLGELLAARDAAAPAEGEDLLEQLGGRAPAAVVESIEAELRAMPEAARDLAFGVAVLGDRAPLPQAARVAELDLRAASDAADLLAQIGLVDDGLPLCFVSPMLRTAVLAAMPRVWKALAHRRAAAVLDQHGAPPEAVAGHLLSAPAERDANAVRALRVAARDNLRRGDPGEAVRLLARALEERPSPDPSPDLVAELGEAEALAGTSRASDRLREAISVTGEPERRAELALTRGQVLLGQKDYREAASSFDAGLRELSERDTKLAGQLEAAYISAAALVPELVAEAGRRRRHMLEAIDGAPDAQQRAALAHSVVQDSLRGESREKVQALTDMAWSDGAFLRAHPPAAPSLSCLTGALLFVDELERDLELCDAARAHAAERDSVIPTAVVSHFRAWPLYERGEIREARAEAEAALDAPEDLHITVRTAYATLACCQLLAGEFDKAEKALAIIESDDLRPTLRYPALLEVRAQLRLAQHRPDEALQDALSAGRILESEFSVGNPGTVAWRSTAALAHVALGRPALAEELALEELERAQQIGVTRVAIRDLRVLGLAAGGKPGIERLEQAVELAERSPPRLESMHAVLDLGAALRRAKKRAAARDPLRRALELGERHGAKIVADRARTELAATGSRSRGLMLSGVESLTPSERRVADLAAQGMTTRMIAEALFITRKTVEYHLRHIYQKVEVGSRAELAAVLSKHDGARLSES